MAMHPHEQQHEHIRETDDVFEEFRAIFQRARRSASEALRAHRSRQAALDRARRARLSSARETVRSVPDRDTAPDKTRVHIREHDRQSGISPDLIARWAAAHAVADQFREEAKAAEARAAESRESSDAAQAATKSGDADLADTWRSAWDDRVREAGFDPDELAREEQYDQEVADSYDDERDPAAVPDRQVDAGTPEVDDFAYDVAQQAADMAMTAADTLDTSTGHDQSRSAADLIDDTRPPDGTELTPADQTPHLSAAPGADLGPSVDVSVGVSQ